jgi:hypothetical protein
MFVAFIIPLGRALNCAALTMVYFNATVQLITALLVRKEKERRT